MIELKNEEKNIKQGTFQKKIYATGKRKNSIAKVWLSPKGSGKITINKKDFNKYFNSPFFSMIIKQPFDAVQNNSFDTIITVNGGGLSGQAGAIKLAISRALSTIDPKFRPPLKQKGYLTRDSRVVERKKYGRKKARRSFQFSKR